MKPDMAAEIRLFSLYCICLKAKGFTVIGKNVLNTSRHGFVFYRTNRPIYSVWCVLCIYVMLHVKFFVNKLLQTAVVSE